MQILSTTPAQKGINVGLKQPIAITFDNPIDESTIDVASITVSSKKTNIVKVENGLPQPGSIFQSDNFFTDEFTGVVEGTISVSGADLIFTPKKLYQAETEYTVTIGSGIASSSDASVLDRIKYFTFTTAAEDLAVESLPEVTQEPVSIIGREIQFDTIQVASVDFYVSKTSPKKDSFLVTRKDIKVSFNKDIGADSGSKVAVYRYDLFSDFPPEELTSGTEYTTAVNASDITITLADDAVKENSIYEIVIDKSITSTANNVLTEDFSFSYINELSPYYTSTRLLRLKAGTVLSAVTDINMAMIIHYASLEADEKLSKVNIDDITRKLLRSKYALYSAIESILLNNHNYGLADYINKQLAEFSLATSNKSKLKLYNTLLEDVRNFKRMFDSYLNFVASRGYFRKNTTPNDIGRMWRPGARPGLNTKVPSKHSDRMVYVWDTYGEQL